MFVFFTSYKARKKVLKMLILVEKSQWIHHFVVTQSIFNLHTCSNMSHQVIKKGVCAL